MPVRDQVVCAAELHDVGKVAIPDAILHKPGPLDAGEAARLRRHVEIGEAMLRDTPALRRRGRARAREP